MRGVLKAIAIRAAVVFVAVIVVSACLIGGIGFALAAVYLQISTDTDSATAAIATTGVALVLALAVAALVAVALRRRARPVRREFGTATGTRASADARLAGAGAWIADNPKTAALAALGAGLVLGFCPQIRKDLLNAAASALRPPPPRGP